MRQVFGGLPQSDRVLHIATVFSHRVQPPYSATMLGRRVRSPYSAAVLSRRVRLPCMATLSSRRIRSPRSAAAAFCRSLLLHATAAQHRCLRQEGLESCQGVYNWPQIASPWPQALYWSRSEAVQTSVRGADIICTRCELILG